MSQPSAQQVSADVHLSISNIEVVYDHIILVLKGISLVVPRGRIVALLGGNGAGKSTTMKAVSTLLATERGTITKGSITLNGERTDHLTPNLMVRRKLALVMEGRHCFPHLTIEENLLTGFYTRRLSSSEIRNELERIYTYFPRLKTRRKSLAGYTSGGEQQMCAIGRALMTDPDIILLDEPSMGLAPQIVEEIFELVKQLNTQEGASFLIAEQNTAIALRYAHFGYIMENGRIMMEGAAEELSQNADVRQFYLGVSESTKGTFRNTKHYHRRKRWLS